MSLWREVLSGILAKNRTLKCLKWHYLTVQSLKNVAVVTEDGTFALFLRPPPLGGLTAQESPSPREFAIQGEKMLMPRGQPAAGID